VASSHVVLVQQTKLAWATTIVLLCSDCPLQVIAAAAVRLQHEAAERAAQEASSHNFQALRLSALNLQAQARAQQKRTQKQQLAVSMKLFGCRGGTGLVHLYGGVFMCYTMSL
jgi:hypothetical protein